MRVATLSMSQAPADSRTPPPTSMVTNTLVRDVTSVGSTGIHAKRCWSWRVERSASTADGSGRRSPATSLSSLATRASTAAAPIRTSADTNTMAKKTARDHSQRASDTTV